jgi:ABC-2 type transport system ATP-binding protein
VPTPAAAAAVPALRFAGVSKRYGRAEVLRAVSFEVPAGSAFGLAGVNGAGKTTLLKCMLDLAAADSGSIEIFGVPHRVPASRARIGFLPERFVPPWYLTGRDFLRFMRELDGAAYGEDDVAAMMTALDLDPSALTRPARSYSKGMTQKLGLAACFLSRRDLYVLDEPMSGLDPKARACLKDLLAAERARGATLFFTSHALADIEAVCDELAVLHRGVPYFSGAPRALCDHYRESSLERAFLRCIEAPAPCQTTTNPHCSSSTTTR